MHCICTVAHLRKDGPADHTIATAPSRTAATHKWLWGIGGGLSDVARAERITRAGGTRHCTGKQTFSSSNSNWPHYHMLCMCIQSHLNSSC